MTAPGRDNRVSTPSVNLIRLYFDYFKVLNSVCSLVLEILDYYKIHISQLTLNAVGRIIGFEVLCQNKSRASPVRLFWYFYQMKLSQDWFSFST